MGLHKKSEPGLGLHKNGLNERLDFGRSPRPARGVAGAASAVARAAIAVAGTLLSVALRCAEVLSYHYLDAVLYAQAGKVMVVSILWMALTLLTCLGVWIDSRKRVYILG